ncbi:MAG: hypothetical protein IT269_05715, partial [Saprospiraceae bacterium]|nr:hypothetical protein [Saprospiraceae bacterium]
MNTPEHFISVPPAVALRMPDADIMQHLLDTWGETFYQALDPNFSIASPLSTRKDGVAWLKRANTVGVNIRTIGTFWRLIPYCMTLPKAQNTIHILPIWEPGVVASLYGPSSWNINPEFFDFALQSAIPHLDTVEKQLKVVINILHLMGFSVGMDVVPHTDRYSEMVLANPSFFEWLQRRDMEILRHNSELWREVRQCIFEYVQARGSAVPDTPIPEQPETLYETWPESTRLRVLFGEKYDYEGRLNRRKELVELLYQMGFETTPATMGPPYRGLEVDPSPQALTVDEEGRVWRDYRIANPQKFSRAFGPLTRYRLYESLNDNSHWQLDFSRPIAPVWQYVCDNYRRIQAEFGFDFMRGDMSHVQMRPDGVPAQPDGFYDLLGAVKQSVLPEKPWFGYFAESFLAPPDEMAYGDECDHLEASLADSTLGDLQSEPVGTEKFARDFAQYRHWLDTRKFAPNFTIMTADKDDPRFDSFYLTGNEIRYFIALFLTDMPSYMGLGFESRDPHPTPAPNEHYTKLYVFQLSDGPKGTRGPYQWGNNVELYERLVRQKLFSNTIHDQIAEADIQWLLPPDPTGERRIFAWTQARNPQYIFAANLDTEKAHHL